MRGFPPLAKTCRFLCRPCIYLNCFFNGLAGNRFRLRALKIFSLKFLAVDLERRDETASKLWLVHGQSDFVHFCAFATWHPGTLFTSTPSRVSSSSALVRKWVALTERHQKSRCITRDAFEKWLLHSCTAEARPQTNPLNSSLWQLQQS